MKEKAYANNYYHLYNRGNNYQKIFFNERNYQFFLKRILEKFDNKIDIIAYVLMPNHYHFIIKPNEDEYIEKAMQKFATSYTKAINNAEGRIGHLFQGRYKIKLVPEDSYLVHLSRYIHLNPVRADLVSKPENWRYSSYTDYVGISNREFIKSEIILNEMKNYREFVEEFQDDQSYYVSKLLFI